MMRTRFLVVSAIVAIGLGLGSASAQTAGAIPAFPGAEGFGAYSVGGRGGTVLKVTNLNDSGAGSFRAAVTASGARIVVFTVSGIINLASPILIDDDYLTIAGETSPGGICITGYTVTIWAHDVIIRHMRFRVGSHRIADGADPETLDSLDIFGSAVPQGGGKVGSDIIIDHCSISWGVDETFSISYNAQHVTVQWSIISEGLSQAGHPKGEHSKGLLVSGKSGAPTVSIHHNYIAHNTDRNPLVGAGCATGDGTPLVDVVNNVIYNWKGNLSMTSQCRIQVNWVHNYVKRGASSNSFSFEAIHYPYETTIPMSPMIFVQGNLGGRRLSQSDPQWAVGFSYKDIYLDTGYQALTRWSAPSVKTSVMSSTVADSILASVGATAPVRDAVDARVVAGFAAGTGTIPLNVNYPGDFPTYQGVAAPADLDNDGMADAWETANGMNPKVNDAALDRDGDGYTNIEEYLHALSGRLPTIPALPHAPLHVTIR